MPGLLEGLMEGYTTGKAHQRQSLLDQLEQQRYKEQLDLEKQNLNLRTKTFQFQQQESQRKGLVDQLQQEAEQYNKLGYAFFPQQPEALQEQMPPEQAYGATSLPSRASIVPIPKKAEAPVRGTPEYLKALEAEEKIKAKYPAGGEPTGEEQDVYSYQADQKKLGRTLSFNQAKTELIKQRQSPANQPGLTTDQVLQKRDEFINRYPERPISQFYKEIRLSAPEISDSLAAEEFGISKEDAQMLLQHKDYGAWRGKWFQDNRAWMSEQEQKAWQDLAKKFFKQEVQEKFK